MYTLGGFMKPNQLKIRISDRRMDKLRLYARKKDKTMTSLIEEFIDNLPELSETQSFEEKIFADN